MGIGLIYLANRKIVQSNSLVNTNWLQYFVHILMLTSVSVSTYLYQINHSRAYLIAAVTLETLLSTLVCYIVWSQAFSVQLSDYDFTIVEEPDGSQRLVCRLSA